MPHIYKHKTSGWRIIYKIHFSDRAPVTKTRYAKKRVDAQAIFKDAEHLETTSRKGQLTKREIAAAMSLRYLTADEASALQGHRVCNYSWNDLRKKYEDWARAYCAQTTINCNNPKLDRVEKYFSSFSPTEVKEDDVKKYIETRKNEKAKDATIRKELVILRKLLDFSGDENPARKVPLLKVEDERVPRPLHPQEIREFLNGLESRKAYLGGNLKAMTIMYLYAGLRPSEIVRLKHEDINLRAEKIHVQGRTKTGHARSVDMHPTLKALIEIALKNKKGEYLFGGERPYDVNSFGREVRKVITTAKLKGITPYSLRHSFITYLLMAGADLRKTMEQAGHKKLTTTTRYLHVIPTRDSPVKRIDFGVNDGEDAAN